MREAPVRFASSISAKESELEQDTLGMLPYAQALKDFIETCDTPMTIGIQGDWGSGKTSLVNMLRGEEGLARSGLLSGTNTRIVNFETWSYAQFNQDEMLPLACLYALCRKVEEVLDRERPEEARRGGDTTAGPTGRLLHVLKNLKIDKVSVAGVGIDVSADTPEIPFTYNDIPEQMIQFRNEFQSLVNEWAGKDPKKRIVIFIDDLDRVKPIRSLELLEAVKNFLDVEGCVFILAVDYEIVQQGMIEKLGRDVQKTSGKSFFDKIIQLPFSMPSASYDTENYVMGLLRNSGLPGIDRLSGKRGDVEFFTEITLCTIGPNSRSIKRVANYVKLLGAIREKSRSREQFGRATQQDSKILYALICMQIAWPELFGYFCKDPSAETISNMEDWEFLEKLPDSRRLFERVHDVDATKNNIATFVDRFFELLDENQDGAIGNEEMAPVHKVLEMSKLTSLDIQERPRDFILKQALKMGGDQNLIKDIFQKSLWHTNKELGYRKSGNRYVTLVWNRRQIGTIIALKARPFIFRLTIPSELILERIRSTHGDYSELSNLESIIRPLNEREQNLTGYGNTIINCAELMKLGDQNAVEMLNALFSVATKAIPSSNHQ